MTHMCSLQRLLRPKNIAVVGGDWAEEVIRQCDRAGFQGEIWPINPRRPSMAGRICYPNVRSLPQGPDVTFIAVGRKATLEVVADLAELDAGGVVCFASGFSEIGGEGIELQARLVSAAGQLALMGPNCYGLLNYLDGITLWPDQHGGEAVERGVAVIAQSGNIGLSLTMQQRSVSLAYLISMGNQAGVAVHEVVEALLEDERVTAIGLHLEGLVDVVAFSRVASKALAKKVPIVVIKSGATELGGKMTLTHTSSLAGSDELYDALFERVGIVRVQSLPQFMETLKFLSVIGPLPGSRIATISSSGGEAALLADRAVALGLSFAPLEDGQRRELAMVLGDRVALANPLDYHTYIWGDAEAQYRCFSAMLLGQQDITFKVIDYPRADVCDDRAWSQTVQAFRRAVVDQGVRGAVVSTLPENLPLKARDALLPYGIAPMQGLEECLLAVRAAAWLYEKQRCQPRIEPLAEVVDSNRPVIVLDERQSKQLLARYGIPIPQAAACTAEEAVQAAEKIGFPVVVKTLSAKIVHKSDVGGIRLNLSSPAAVRQAIDEMQGLAERFLIEAMVPSPAVEIIVGLIRDPQFGLALVVGAGGLFVELFDDQVTLLFPVSREDVERAIDSLKIAPLLNGYRSRPAADRVALVDAVMNIACFAEDYAGDIAEVDINPLLVLAEGCGVVAVDAVIRITKEIEHG